MSSVAKTLLALLATLPATYASSVILGDTSGDPRGTDSIDIQTYRGSPAEVTYGWNAVGVGMGNTTGNESASFGLYNITTGWQSSSFGLGNEVTVDSATAVGLCNYVYAPPGQFYDDPTGAFGFLNTINSAAGGSFSFGRNNTINAMRATVFGAGITNGTPSSTMIGPSDAAKVTILSTGNVGIGLGTASPTQKLDVGGNIRLSGNIINASGNTLALPSGAGTLVTTSGTQTITGTTTVHGTTTLGGASPAQQLKVDVSTGNVGIGTASATSKLTVVGGASIASTPANAPANGLYVEGNVGIGTSTPGAKLAVTGSGLFNGRVAVMSTAMPTNKYLQVGSTTPIFDDFSWVIGVESRPINTGTAGVIGFYSNPVHNPSPSSPMPSGLVDVTAFKAQPRVDSRQVTYTKAFEAMTPFMASGTNSQAAIGLFIHQQKTPAAFQPSYGVLQVSPLDLNSFGGNVGIGTQNPASKLEVVGATKLDGAVTITNTVTVKNNAVIRVSPAGDIAMAPEFQSGTNPAN